MSLDDFVNNPEKNLASLKKTDSISPFSFSLEQRRNILINYLYLQVSRGRWDDVADLASQISRLDQGYGESEGFKPL